jgi:hypothetical protein
VILLVAFVLGLATVPLAGGDLRALGQLRARLGLGLSLRRWPLLAVALALQVVALKAPVPRDTAIALNLGTYALGCWYLLANLRIPGVWVVAAGASANVVALTANGGVMPASARALSTAGLRTASVGFMNSMVVPHARLSFLGDVFAVPRSWPLANVFSVGDVLLVVGALVVAHRLCRPDNPAAGSSVSGVEVDQAEQLLTRREPAHVLPDALGQGADGHARGVGRVGRDQATGVAPERVAVGQGLGVGDVEGGAPDPALVERPHEVGGHDVPAPGHIDQPGVVGHGVELGSGDDALRLRGKGQRHHHAVGVGQGLVQAVEADRAGRPLQRLGPAPHDRRFHIEGLEQAEELLGDATGAQDCHPTAEE